MFLLKKFFFLFFAPFLFSCSTTNNDIERIQRNMIASGKVGGCLSIKKSHNRVYTILDVCLNETFVANYKCSPTLIGTSTKRIGTATYSYPKFIETCNFKIIKENLNVRAER